MFADLLFFGARVYISSNERTSTAKTAASLAA